MLLFFFLIVSCSYFMDAVSSHISLRILTVFFLHFKSFLQLTIICDIFKAFLLFLVLPFMFGALFKCPCLRMVY